MLKALVIGMGLLIVGGTVLMIVKILEMADSPAALETGFGTLGLGMAESCQVVGTTATQGGVIVRYSGPAQDGCDVLHVVDPMSGELVGVIAPHAMPRQDNGDGQGGQ